MMVCLTIEGGGEPLPESGSIGVIIAETRKQKLLGSSYSTLSTTFSTENKKKWIFGIISYSTGDYIQTYTIRDESNAILSGFFNEDIVDPFNCSTVGYKLSIKSISLLHNFGFSDLGSEYQYTNGNTTKGFKFRTNMSEHSIGVEWYQSVSIGNCDYVQYHNFSIDAGLLSLLFIWDGSALEWYYPSTSPRLYPGFSF